MIHDLYYDRTKEGTTRVLVTQIPFRRLQLFTPPGHLDQSPERALVFPTRMHMKGEVGHIYRQQPNIYASVEGYHNGG